MNKKPTLYVIIIVIWVLCLALLIYSLATASDGLGAVPPVRRAAILALLTVNASVLAVLWFGSIKDLVFSIAYAVVGKHLLRRYRDVASISIDPDSPPRVLLLYCTCDDFNPDALTRSARQNYKRMRTVILDDSRDPRYVSEIDRYLEAHPELDVELVRRSERTGYKAGNLNNYLRGRSDYDYFAVLDSDEIIPPDFIIEALKYFKYDSRCGAVQARHEATRGKNLFQRLMGLCVGSNGSTVQIIKNFYGANALIGHGMMISRECYERTGGFPHVVAEDISFAVDISNAGLDIIYAPDILCYEEFPIDYVSLKKRQCKWTQGNLEYMQKYDRNIERSKMTWFEKLDLKLSHYSLPIVPLLSFLLVISTIALGFLGYPVIYYSLLIYAIMILFLCSPMIPDLVVYGGKRQFPLLFPYFIVNIVTYASLAPMMIKTVVLGLLGRRATFAVTPKRSARLTPFEIVQYSRDSLIFAAAIGALSILACGSIMPVIFITVGCALAPAVMVLSNIPVG